MQSQICRQLIFQGRNSVATQESSKHVKRVGEFLVENKIITQAQLREALELQKDNKGRLVGEILVTLGYLSKEDLVMALEMYIVDSDVNPSHVDEWLDQDEVDMIIEKMKEKK
jgi:hypothetical protein